MHGLKPKNLHKQYPSLLGTAKKASLLGYEDSLTTIYSFKVSICLTKAIVWCILYYSFQCVIIYTHLILYTLLLIWATSTTKPLNSDLTINHPYCVYNNLTLFYIPYFYLFLQFLLFDDDERPHINNKNFKCMWQFL